MATLSSRCGCRGCSTDIGCSVCGKCLPLHICAEASISLGGYGVSEEDAEFSLCCFPEDGVIGFPLKASGLIGTEVPEGGEGLKSWSGTLECGGLSVGVIATVYTLNGTCYITAVSPIDESSRNTMAVDAAWNVNPSVSITVLLSDDLGSVNVDIGGSDWFQPPISEVERGVSCATSACLCRCLPINFCVHLELEQRPDLGIFGVPNSGTILCQPAFVCRSAYTIPVSPVEVEDNCGNTRTLTGCSWGQELACDLFSVGFGVTISRDLNITDVYGSSGDYECAGLLVVGDHQEVFFLGEDCDLPTGTVTLPTVVLSDNRYYDPVVSWRPSPCEECQVDELFSARCAGACFSVDIDPLLDGGEFEPACQCAGLVASLISDCEEYQGSWGITYGGCGSSGKVAPPDPADPQTCDTQNWWFHSLSGESWCDETHSLNIRLGYLDPQISCPAEAKNVGEDITRYRLYYSIGSVSTPTVEILSAAPIAGSCDPFRLDFEVPSPFCCYGDAILRITQ